MTETIPTDPSGMPESDFLLDAAIDAHKGDDRKFAAFRDWMERLAESPETLLSDPHAISTVGRVLSETAPMRTFPEDFPPALRAEVQRLDGTRQEALEVVLRWEGHLMAEKTNRFATGQPI